MTAVSRGNRTVPQNADGMRLNRYIARSGIASRRNCDDGILNGMVTVNGKLAMNPAYRIKTGDTILWDGSAVTLPVLFIAAMNKPSGYETTMDANSPRPVSLLSRGMPEASAPVGRLDIKTGGILLWSNDGELVHRLSHPRWKVEREYLIKTAKPVNPEQVESLRKGAFIQPRVFSRPQSVKQTGKTEISLVLKTGRNREVRRLAAVCRVPLIGLERTRYGTISVSGIDRGTWRELTVEEGRELCSLVGLNR